jgi:alpha-galactosidase
MFFGKLATRRFCITLVFSIAVGSSVWGEPTSVALAPPMGWNSWNYFGEKVDDAVVRAAADQIVATGLKSAGYVYVNIDDTWEGQRDARGIIHPNAKFPDMKALADYVHSKGLKIGLYSSPGPKTCAGYEGSFGHEELDARTYAEWGIDYLKYDLCSFRSIMQAKAPDDSSAQIRMMIASYDKMAAAIKATGRPIVFSFCQYGVGAPWEWAPAIGGNLWRTTHDISPDWDGIYSIISLEAGLERYAGPGHWNDPDMLEVGNGDLSLAENRMHFTMWAMLAAPLLAGNDLEHIRPEIKSILTNRDVIAIDQDRAGKQGLRAYVDGQVEVWTRTLSDGSVAVAVLNIGSERFSMYPFHLDLARIGLRGPMTAKDLWSGKSIAVTDDMPIELATHDVLLFKTAPHR